MNAELAEHISALAAPIYAVLLAKIVDVKVSQEALASMRQQAIEQAHALWLQTLDTET